MEAKAWLAMDPFATTAAPGPRWTQPGRLVRTAAPTRDAESYACASTIQRSQNGGEMERKDSAESVISKFYNEGGWNVTDGVTADAEKFEDLRPAASNYVSRCRLRVARHIPQNGGQNLIDMASGPIQYPEYLEYSKGFTRRHCVDLSADALAQAKAKIGDHGVYHHGNFFDLPFERDFFDCALSLHTIYHIDENKQEGAVRKLVEITRPGAPVIIVYSNPSTLIASIKSALRRGSGVGELYFHRHPLSWWQRFGDVAEVNIYPWRSFGAAAQRAMFPDNVFGRWMFKALFLLEEAFPQFFVKHFQYPMIVLKKRSPAVPAPPEVAVTAN
jgi:SAM-dependent methyltransferase